ncbi:MAG: hypothetical protein WCX79_00315 [Candidatus Paceibacterota bacterium]|jgi:uncharacterized protein YwgA
MPTTKFTDKELILIRTLGLLGVEEINIENDNNHTQCQKLIYLLQNMRGGVSLGYGYEWRVKGPHSPELGNDLRNITDKLKIVNSYRN